MKYVDLEPAYKRLEVLIAGPSPALWNDLRRLPHQLPELPMGNQDPSRQPLVAAPSPVGPTSRLP